MLKMKLNSELELVIEDLKLKGFTGADLVSQINDLSRLFQGGNLLDSDDKRVTDMIDIAISIKYETNADKLLLLKKESEELAKTHLDFYKEIEENSKLSFKNMYPVVKNILEYYKVDNRFISPDLYTAYDLMVILETTAKEPSNNLKSFLMVLQTQMTT